MSASRAPFLHNRGFTLIEIMVVASIISLLSSIVLFATDGARKQADNAYRINTVDQYVQGLLLYAQTWGGFPWPSVPEPTGICFANTGCLYWSPITPSATDVGLSTRLSSFITVGKPFNPTPDPVVNLIDQGPLYYQDPDPLNSPISTSDGNVLRVVDIRFTLWGNKDCAMPSVGISATIKNYSPSMNTTSCFITVTLPTHWH